MMATASNEATTNGSVLEQLADRVAHLVSARRITGDPVERGEVTVIPVARSVFGFGGGSGPEADARGYPGAGGGGGVVLPVGYIEIRDGKTRFRPIFDPILLIPIAFATLRTVKRLLRRWTK
jgi:uncharacterized spore protein YtfJ